MVSVVYIRRLCDEEQSILILIKGCKHKTGAYNQGSMVGIQLEMTVEHTLHLIRRGNSE